MTSFAHLQNLLSYDPETGEFRWRATRRGGAKIGQIAGADRADGRRQIRVAGRMYLAHRLAWLFSNGQWPSQVIDHIDGNPQNNRIANLRDASIQANQENQRRAQRSNRSSGLLGSHFDAQTGRWMAKISVMNKTIHIGRYDTPQEAHTAYVSAKRNLHKGGML